MQHFIIIKRITGSSRFMKENLLSGLLEKKLPVGC